MAAAEEEEGGGHGESSHSVPRSSPTTQLTPTHLASSLLALCLYYLGPAASFLSEPTRTSIAEARPRVKQRLELVQEMVALF